MADRKGPRSSSRRTTPAHQPPPAKATTPQTGREMRNKRGTRSASRDVESVAAAKTGTRRTRQASVASETDQEGPSTRRPKKKALDLTTVEEVDTQTAIQDAPETPPRTQPGMVSHRSPSAQSEMSGTTAITSFTMAEAEALDPFFITLHLPKLYNEATDFLQHLAKDDNRLDDDKRNMLEMQRPDSTFDKRYRSHLELVNVHLKYFRGEHNHYINLLAVHRALLGQNHDVTPTESGLDLVLYLANLLIFAKQVISSGGSDNEMWDALRNLDETSFPILFLPTFVPENSLDISALRQSSLLDQTFKLGLDLRTQRFILMLQRAMEKGNENAELLLDEVFYGSDASQEELFRGWAVDGLRSLSSEHNHSVGVRVNSISEFCAMDLKSKETGEPPDLEGLKENFPWSVTIIETLNWVRLRAREIKMAIHEQGGITAITERVQTKVQDTCARQNRATSLPKGTPRKKRTSFGRDRRRSSRKFDPNAQDFGEVDALKAREQAAQQAEVEAPRLVEQPAQQIQEEVVAPVVEQEELQPIYNDDDDMEELEDQQQPETSASASGPPRTAAELERLMRASKEGTKIQNKENVRSGFFDRQPTAERIGFGNGFDDSQPTPGPSRPSRKGKEPQRAPPTKRRRGTDDDSEDDDVFETAAPSSRVQERRQNAPVAKKARFDQPASSATAPTSHQPPPGNAIQAQSADAQDESVSEVEAPDMTEEIEEAPPSSNYNKIRQLARANNPPKPRKRPTAWSPQQESALEQYVGIFGPRYATILQHDASDDGLGMLQDRTQVNLKDKVRNMAINMIKSNTPLSEGFKGIITANSAVGRRLIDDGFEV